MPTVGPGVTSRTRRAVVDATASFREDRLMKARVFIGSSSEGLPIANAIQENLQRDAYCDVWTQGIFGLGQTTMDALLQAVTDHDFGVFVLSPDDIQVIRKNAYSAPRDNVLLESALFMGRYAGTPQSCWGIVPTRSPTGTGNGLELQTVGLQNSLWIIRFAVPGAVAKW
jgi:hypothetical protein